MISLDNLTVSYGGWTLFDNISFLINPKDRIGLVGKNGAGKTTLLRIITGEQQPTSGAVTLNGDCTIGCTCNYDLIQRTGCRFFHRYIYYTLFFY